MFLLLFTGNSEMTLTFTVNFTEVKVDCEKIGEIARNDDGYNWHPDTQNAFNFTAVKCIHLLGLFGSLNPTEGPMPRSGKGFGFFDVVKEAIPVALDFGKLAIESVKTIGNVQL